MAEERDLFNGNCKELTQEVQYMPGLAEKAKSLRASVAKMEDASRKKALKVSTKLRTADMELDAE